MATDLAKAAKQKGIQYFLISFTDLFGVMRAKLVPAAAIAGMQKDGAGFAGFAAWLDMTPADSDMFGVPDPDSLIQLPWKPEVGWLAADLYLDGAEVAHAPRNTLKRVLADATKKGYRMKTGVEPEYFLISPDGSDISDPGDRQTKPCYDQSALMRRYDVIKDAGTRLGPVSERPRGRQRPVRDELGLQRRPGHRRSARVFQIHGQGAGRKARPARHFHAKPLRQPDRQWLPCPCQPVGQGGQEEPVLGSEGRAWRLEAGLPVHGRDDGACSGDDGDHQPDGEFVQAAERLDDLVGRHLVAQHGHLWRQQPHHDDAHPRSDGAANPYLFPAVLLAAGMDGIGNKLDPGKRVDLDMFSEGHKVKGARKLPLNLLDALRDLGRDKGLSAALGQQTVDSFIKLKMIEWNAYTAHLSQWERDNTLDC
jgi:glutamine synthetase